MMLRLSALTAKAGHFKIQLVAPRVAHVKRGSISRWSKKVIALNVNPAVVRVVSHTLHATFVRQDASLVETERLIVASAIRASFSF